MFTSSTAEILLQGIYSMKELRIIFTMAILFASSGLYAQIVNLTTLSAEWQRTGNRNAATDAADIVFYNPAGLTKMADGIYLNISNQTLLRFPEHTVDYSPMGGTEKTYSHEGVDWFVPNAFFAYKKDNWAVFTGFFIPAGGASVHYPDGSITTEMIGNMASEAPVIDQSLDASSIYISGMVGGSYAVNEMISIAAGIRYVNAENRIKGEATGALGTVNVDIAETADGFSGVIGINITPLPELNIGMRYETITIMKFETEVKEDTTGLGMFTDGEKNRNDIPAVFAVGAMYTLTPDLALEADFNYYFQTQADWGKDDDGDDYSRHAGDSFMTGAAIIYKVNRKITASAGITYSVFLWENQDAYYTKLGAYETLYGDNLAIMAGAAVEVADGIRLNLAYSYTWWMDDTTLAGDLNVKTSNSAHALAVGADCRF